jgi:DNA polymerase-3 subunit delta
MALGEKSKKHDAIYVIASKEPALANAACDKLLDDLIAPDQRQTGLLVADVDKAQILDIFDELRTLPFLAEKRVVLIKKADSFITQYRPTLEKYFEKPSPTGILIFTVQSWKANTKLAKKLPAVGKLIRSDPPKPAQIPAMLTAYAAEKYNKTLSRPTALALFELIGEDISRLYSEIDKLDIFTYTEKNITLDHVAQLVGPDRLYNAFGVIDAMMAKQSINAVTRLRNLFAADPSTEFTIIGALAWQIRRLFNAKAMLDENQNRQFIAKSLNIWHNSNDFFNRLTNISQNELAKQLIALADIDHQIKTGQSKPKSAIETFILEFSTS